MSNYDTFDSAATRDVLQEDPPNLAAVDVVVRGVVRTDEMPCIPNASFKVLRANQPAEKVLSKNPRRKLVVVQNLSSLVAADASEFIMIARTKGQCDAFAGFLLAAQNALVRYEFPWPDEMYARGINMASAAGVVGAFSAATTDCLLNIATFDWTE